MNMYTGKDKKKEIKYISLFAEPEFNIEP